MRAFLVLVIGTILLSDCGASQQAVSAWRISAQEGRDRAACLEGAHTETTYDEKSFASCMTARGYNEDKLYSSGSTANAGRPLGSGTLNTTAREANGPAVTARENYDRAVANY